MDFTITLVSNADTNQKEQSANTLTNFTNVIIPPFTIGVNWEVALVFFFVTINSFTTALTLLKWAAI